ncbi:MAG: SemiSWEET family sugar transporter [Nitrososphaera sp.]
MLFESLSQDMLISIIGIAAGGLTTSSFVPQIIKAYRTKSMGDVSRYLMGIFATGTVLWIVYGVYKADLVIIGANAVAVAFNIILLCMKFAYAKKPAKMV